MRRHLLVATIFTLVIMMNGTSFAAERNIIGKWTITFKGYQGNEQVGTSYVTENATLRITKQKGQSFAGTVQIDGQSNKYILTGNIHEDNVTMVMGGNTFIRGNAYDTSKGIRMDIIIESQQMSDSDAQGVFNGVAIKQ